MSSGQKAVAEDEDEWDDFQKEHGIAEYGWKLYSREQDHAKVAVEKFGYYGVTILAYVCWQRKCDEALAEFKRDIEIINAFQGVKNKYRF